MQRWKRVIPLLAAMVLCLSMISVAVAGEGPPDHSEAQQACEHTNNPPHCQEGEGEDGDVHPLASLGEVCSQIVTTIADNDPTDQFIQLHALCEALGAEPLDDDGDSGGGGGDGNPAQALIDGCRELSTATGGQLDALCQQFESFPPEGGGEGSPVQPLVDGCYQLVQALVDNGPAEFAAGEDICDEFAAQAGADEQNIDEGDGGADTDPTAALGELCSELVQAIAEYDPTDQFIQLHALCEALGADPLDEEPGNGGGSTAPREALIEQCYAFAGHVAGTPFGEYARAFCDAASGEGEGPSAPELPDDPKQALIEQCYAFAGHAAGTPFGTYARAFCDAASGEGEGSPPEFPDDPKQALIDQCYVFAGQVAGTPLGTYATAFCHAASGEGEGPSGPDFPADPREALFDQCESFVDQLESNGAPAPLSEGAQTFCDALDGGGGGFPPAPPEGDPRDILAGYCDTFVEQLAGTPAPPQLVGGAQMFCDALSGGGEFPPEFPAGPRDALIDQCEGLADQLESNGAPAELVDGVQTFCDAAGGGGDFPPAPPSGDESPLAQLKQGCQDVTGALTGHVSQLAPLADLCANMP